MPGAPDANAAWERHRDWALTNWGWHRVQAEPAMFVVELPTGVARCEADNDDFLFTAPTDADVESLLAPLRKAWSVTVQYLRHAHDSAQRRTAISKDDAGASLQHVGITLTRLENGGISMTNNKHIDALLAAHKMRACNPAALPCLPSADLRAFHNGDVPTDQRAYQSLIGSFRFLADSTHPDIAYITAVLGRHLHQPAERHVRHAKHLLRYLQGRRDSGIVFRRQGPLQLAGWSDSDYASDPDTRRSVTGVVCTASDQPVLWSSARQKVVTHSSTEAEYVAANHAARDLVYLVNLARELRVPLVTRPPTLRVDDKPATRYHHGRIVVDERPDIPLMMDNKGAIDIGHARGPTKRTKHLDVKLHYMQDLVTNGVLRLEQVGTAEQRADFLTKLLARGKFTLACHQLGLLGSESRGV